MFWFKSSKDKFQTLFAMKFSIQPSITIKLLTHPQYPTFLYGYCVRTDIYTHVYAFQTISCRFFPTFWKNLYIIYMKSKKRNTRRKWFSWMIFNFYLFIFVTHFFFEWGTNGLEGDVEIINFHIHEQEGKQMQ